MKQMIQLGRCGIVLTFLLILFSGAVFATGQWITTDKIWDDDRPQPNETFTWSGGHDNDGFATGPGVLQWYIDGKPENRFEGNMLKGKINGKGSCTFTSGNSYDGDWADGQRTGKGVFIWTNGNRYEGDFAKDRRTGKGMMAFANGERYEGDWVDGRRTGMGVMTYTNGDRYEGDWVDDRITGMGIKTFADGRRMEGKWDNGGFAGPKQNYNQTFLVFLFIAAVASWVTGLTLKDGRLAWRQVLKYTGLYLVFAFITACLLDFRLLWQFVLNWSDTDAGIYSHIYAFPLFGLIAALITGFRVKGGFPWRRTLTCLVLYVFFTLLLLVIWGVYATIYTIFILRFVGH